MGAVENWAMAHAGPLRKQTHDGKQRRRCERPIEAVWGTRSFARAAAGQACSAPEAHTSRQGSGPFVPAPAGVLCRIIGAAGTGGKNEMRPRRGRLCAMVKSNVRVLRRRTAANRSRCDRQRAYPSTIRPIANTHTEATSIVNIWPSEIVSDNCKTIANGGTPSPNICSPRPTAAHGLESMGNICKDASPAIILAARRLAHRGEVTTTARGQSRPKSPAIPPERIPWQLAGAATISPWSLGPGGCAVPAADKAGCSTGLIRMAAECANCHLRYEREPGYFLGSIYINYGLTALLVTAGYSGNLLQRHRTDPQTALWIVDCFCDCVSDLVFSLRAQPVAGLRSLLGPDAEEAGRPPHALRQSLRRRSRAASRAKLRPALSLELADLTSLLALYGSIHEAGECAHDRKGHRHHEQDAVVDAAGKVAVRVIASQSRLATGTGRSHRRRAQTRSRPHSDGDHKPRESLSASFMIATRSLLPRPNRCGDRDLLDCRRL